MDWQTVVPIMVRTLINDLDENPTYSDNRLLQIITVSAKYVIFDVSLDNYYNVDVVGLTIDPDPVSRLDDIFISLMSLKAAGLVDQSTLRTKAALEGIRAALGPASLSVAGSMTGLRLLLETGPCALYDELTSHWDVKDATAIRAVLSPFTGNKFNPRFLNNYGYRDGDFYS